MTRDRQKSSPCTADEHVDACPQGVRVQLRQLRAERRAASLILVASAGMISACDAGPIAGAPVAEPPSETAVESSEALFAVEIRIGPGWDAAKQAQEQAYFAEHSASLRRLREAGNLVLGARYADVGLLVLSAESIETARALLDVDPAIVHGTFRYDVHRFNAFYPWSSPVEDEP
jgi:uncharacterized protein YciI